MARLALGTYRMTDTNPGHIATIRMAVSSGVTLIDTSTNYMDGHAEQAIGTALQGLDPEQRAGVEIVSKFGYVQGSTLQRLKEAESFNDVVRYADHIWHCIDAEFIRDQLAHSLSRLQCGRIDCYLIHNPEYYLLDAIEKGVEKADRLDGMLQRIYDAFIALEQEVAAGRIGSYGISSNSFAVDHTSDAFLPYEDLITLAENAAEYVGHTAHAFTTIQLPLNLLERDGEACAQWAKNKGLRVLTNRPLNAQYGGRNYRLAEYDEPRDYYHHLNALLEMFKGETELQPLVNLVSELDGNRHRFGWIGDYEQFFHAQIVPLLRGVFVTLDEPVQVAVAESLDPFFDQYGKMVAYECGQRTRKELEPLLAGCDVSLQECAVRFVLDHPDVDYVLAGMRKPGYVAQFTALT